VLEEYHLRLLEQRLKEFIMSALDDAVANLQAAIDAAATRFAAQISGDASTQFTQANVDAVNKMAAQVSDPSFGEPAVPAPAPAPAPAPQPAPAAPVGQPLAQ
jgi:hypothetical protein